MYQMYSKNEFEKPLFEFLPPTVLSMSSCLENAKFQSMKIAKDCNSIFDLGVFGIYAVISSLLKSCNDCS